MLSIKEDHVALLTGAMSTADMAIPKKIKEDSMYSKIIYLSMIYKSLISESYFSSS